MRCRVRLAVGLQLAADLTHNLNQERRVHSRASRLPRVPRPLGSLGVCRVPFAHNPLGGQEEQEQEEEDAQEQDKEQEQEQE